MGWKQNGIKNKRYYARRNSRLIQNPLLRKFLGIEKFSSLYQAFRSAGSSATQIEVSSHSVLLAVVISVLPALSSYAVTFIDIDLPTILVGISACLAIIFRIRNKIPFHRGGRFKLSLSHVHTAVALGCIPVVLILLLLPSALSHIGGAINLSHSPNTNTPPSTLSVFLIIVQISVWAAVTEEFIFRGLLISVLRRWSSIRSQHTRDILAITISAMLFGLAHLSQWGPAMSIGLVGLGIGFGVGYVAIGEKLLPLILYHTLFDILSLSFALFA